jgi:hypothetical protein
MEDHINQLLNEVQKKAKYVLREIIVSCNWFFVTTGSFSIMLLI